MISAAIPEDEERRIRKLDELDIFDTLEEQAYDDLTKIAAEICDTPIALVSLVDRDRQWFKSHHGLDARETPRDVAFCAHAIHGDDVFVVEDSSKDKRFHDNPLATGAPHVQFYAGAPLIMNNKLRLGTLCVIANEPRTITDAQKYALTALARQVVSQLELRLKIKELQILDQAKDEFISMVSHELRTPLTSIQGSLSLILNDVAGHLAEKQRSMVDIAARNSERLLNIVNDILDVAKLEAGKFTLNKESLDVKELLNKAIELNQQYCATCGCQAKLIDTNQSAVRIDGDEQRLLQVLGNLISNAAKFTDKDDIIELAYSTNTDTVTIKVTDHGPGIPEDQHDMLFRKFKQIGLTDNNKHPGTGLGLNISKHIIELHNGEICFDSVPDEHTTFHFTLPVAL